VELDLGRLQAWLAPRVEGVGTDLSAERISGGQSNPSWLLGSGGRRWVLRAKPAPTAELPPSAHAVEREYAVQSALEGTGVPVPRMRALCEDEAVVGVVFYVMDHVDGRIFREGWAPGLEVSERRELFEGMVEVISRLHTLDVVALGLTGHGRPGDYFSRLFSRWTRMYQATQTVEIPAMDRLIEWLPANLPAHGTDEVTIVHGDYRLENLIVEPDTPRIAAVLDWELSTIGHPLVDIAYTALSWHLSDGGVRGFAGRDLAALGIPTETELVTTYCSLAGRTDTEQVLTDWPFYLGCNFFRLAAILQGIAKRVQQGIAAGPNAAEMGAMAGPVAQIGWDLVAGARAT